MRRRRTARLHLPDTAAELRALTASARALTEPAFGKSAPWIATATPTAVVSSA